MRLGPRLVMAAMLVLTGCGGGEKLTGVDGGGLVITTTSLPRVLTTQAYGVQLGASGGGGDYSWSLTAGSLPSGLELAPDGSIMGKPKVAVTDSFSVRVTSKDGQTATQQLAVTVDPHLCDQLPDTAPAPFADSVLEAAVRRATGAELTCEKASTVTVLRAARLAFDNTSPAVLTLVGIQNLTSLTRLNLHNMRVTDTEPLEGLTNLEDLTLLRNPVTDLSFLGGLTKLTHLTMGWSPTPDLTPLSGLTNLTNLFLGNSDITDITPLGGLAKLKFLSMIQNSITDLSPLRDLTSLTHLGLFFNRPLTDIQPLLDNVGLGLGDDVDLEGTAVSCMDVSALQAKGVLVTSGCP